MAKYRFVGTVFRQVTDTISVVVECDDELEAYNKARTVLEDFPKPHDVEGVPFCFVENRELHEPHLLDLQFVTEVSVEGA